MQIFLEECVVGLEHGHAQVARGLEAHPMRDEWRLDVHGIDSARELAARPPRGTAHHHSILRVEDEIARRLPRQLRVVLPRLRVTRRDEPGIATELGQIATEGLDRRRHAVDAREVDVGDQYNTHDAPPFD
jgi:hypothetical protein